MTAPPTSFGYQLPDDAIQSLVDAPPSPAYLLQPTHTGAEWILILHRNPMLNLSDLARPELKLAGNRFNPDTDAPSRQAGYRALSLLHRPTGAVADVAGVPAGAAISNVRWAPDGSAFAFAALAPGGPGLALYLARPSADPAAAPLLPPGLRLSSASARHSPPRPATAPPRPATAPPQPATGSAR